MAHKLSIAVKIKDDQIVDTLTVFRKDLGQVNETFKKWRTEGYEAYLFMSPDADKRCKQNEGGAIAPTIVEQVADIVRNGKTKRSPKAEEPASINIE